MEINYGLIEGQRNTDWIAGSLPYEVRNPSGDWTPYLPPGEFQRNHVFDSMACVTFSALNSIEVQHKFLTETHRNFSDRFTAKMSGTTDQGNYLFKVADSIRKDGLVDEVVWPTADSFDWNTYYIFPPIDVINKGREFFNDWQVNYEFIDFNRDSLIYHLKQSPIQVTIPGHAVLAFWSTQQVTKFFDSYEPFQKERTEPFGSALKIVLTRKNMNPMVMVEGQKDIWLVRDGKRSLVYNVIAFNLLGGNIDQVQKLTQAQLEAIPDSGLVLAGLPQE